MSTPSNSNKNLNAGKGNQSKPGALSESAYLAQQAADAKAAISQTISEMNANIGQSASVSAWTREFPWLTLGASTVAGFVAAAALVPSKEQQALRRLARIERALHPDAPKSDNREPDDDADGKRKRGRSFTQSIILELIKAVQPALLSMVTAGVAAQAAQPAPDQNGHSAPDPATTG